MKDKCPYCKKTNCVPEVAYTNCRIYGNEYFTVKCAHCNKVLSISMSRTVRLEIVEKSNKKPSETDW